MPRTIVVPLDGSHFAERALPVARTLAERFDGRLILLTTRWNAEFGEAEAYLEQVAAQGDVPVEVQVVHDRAPAEAIEVVALEDADRLVCMTTHGRGALRWALLGSVAEDVVKRAHRPVLLVGRHCAPDWSEPFEHLVACVDASSAADPVVSVSSEWARALDLDVHLVHVMHPLDYEIDSGVEKVLASEVAQLERAGVHASSTVLRRSFVPGALADYATKLPAALLVTTSHSRSGLARVALGSVAMGTVALSPCPVLVAKHL